MASGSSNVNNMIQYGGNTFLPGSSTLLAATQLVLPAGVTPTILYSSVASSTGTNRLIFFKAGGNGSIYQVTSGKSFISPGFYFSRDTTAATNALFGHNTGSISNNSAAGAGDTYYAAGATVYTFNTSCPTASVQAWHPIPVVFPSLMYPFWISDTGGARFEMVMVGYEI